MYISQVFIECLLHTRPGIWYWKMIWPLEDLCLVGEMFVHDNRLLNSMGEEEWQKWHISQGLVRKQKSLCLYKRFNIKPGDQRPVGRHGRVDTRKPGLTHTLLRTVIFPPLPPLNLTELPSVTKFNLERHKEVILVNIIPSLRQEWWWWW